MASKNDKSEILKMYKENRTIEKPYIKKKEFIGILSRLNSSKSTENSSFIKKEIEEINFKNARIPFNISKSNKISRYNSTKNIKRKNKLLIREKPPNIYNAKENIKNDYVNKKFIIQNYKCKNNIFVDNHFIKTVKSNKVSLNNIKNEKIKRIEIFGQDFSLKGFKRSPPKLPSLFSHKYNLKNQKILHKINESFGELNRSNIPNIFYNHLIIDENNITSINKCKYYRISIVQRNKNKLLNIIYYSH